MPTNVPPQYKEAEARYRAAKTPEEKLEALEEMLRLMPKHKGTDKLQADVKARIAKLRRMPKGKTASGGHGFKIPREGTAQVALVGPPNTGKSSLVASLTRATPKVADYPFTTIAPVPGMMPFEDIAFQLVDLPPVSAEHVEPWVYDMIRRADLVWLVVDTDGALEGVDEVRSLLDAKKIGLLPPGREPAGEPPVGFVAKPTVVVVTGHDKPGSGENLDALRELLQDPFPLCSVSAVDGSGFEELKRVTFQSLGIVRVYTKQPGKPPDRDRPFTLPRGSTVEDLARVIHRDVLEHLKFARIWGKSVYDGQPVQRDHVLEEGDVVEIHT